MLTPGMVGSLPLGVNDRSLPDLNDAIAWAKANPIRRLDQIDVSPLIPVVMDVVANLSKENTFRF